MTNSTKSIRKEVDAYFDNTLYYAYVIPALARLHNTHTGRITISDNVSGGDSCVYVSGVWQGYLGDIMELL